MTTHLVERSSALPTLDTDLPSSVLPPEPTTYYLAFTLRSTLASAYGTFPACYDPAKLLTEAEYLQDRTIALPRCQFAFYQPISIPGDFANVELARQARLRKPLPRKRQAA